MINTMKEPHWLAQSQAEIKPGRLEESATTQAQLRELWNRAAPDGQLEDISPDGPASLIWNEGKTSDIRRASDPRGNHA